MKKGSGAAHGHARKHTHAHKHVHGKHPKHHPKHHKTAHHHHKKAHPVHTVGHHQQHAKGLALAPEDVACCVSQALAASLRLQGLPVPGADVLALHRAAGADDERGAPVAVLLEAAAEYGLAGVRLAGFSLVSIEMCLAGAQVEPASEPAIDHDGEVSRLILDEFRSREALGDYTGTGQELRRSHVRERHEVHPRSLILGLDLPGPHAVLATPEGWWSWGELYCPWCEFPDAVIDEAWVIAWQ